MAIIFSTNLFATFVVKGKVLHPLAVVAPAGDDFYPG
jgi:hypothetical protein